MKKSMVTKIATLGAIGVMTVAGASSALAAEWQVPENSSQFVSESDAMARISQAESQGEIVEKTDNAELIKIGDYVYSYSFTKTYEETYKDSDDYYFKKEHAEKQLPKYAEDTGLMLHDAHVTSSTGREWSIESLGQTYTIYYVTGQRYFGILDISRIDVENIDLSVDSLAIPLEDPTAISYSVNELANRNDVEFSSYDETIASVAKFDDNVYVTGHKNGYTIITATATKADGTTVFKCMKVDVLE